MGNKQLRSFLMPNLSFVRTRIMDDGFDWFAEQDFFKNVNSMSIRVAF